MDGEGPGIGLEADPDKTSVNRFALARTHLQTLRQTIELEIPAQRELFEPDLLRAETCIFQLFRAPLTNEGEPEEATEFADPPDGDALREELQAILKRVSDLVEIYLVYLAFSTISACLDHDNSLTWPQNSVPETGTDNWLSRSLRALRDAVG